MATQPTQSAVPDPAARPLTVRQQRFVEEYLVDLNATQAAIRAGYSARAARSIASGLMHMPHIQAAVEAAQAAQQMRTQVTADRVLLELARLALYDPRRFFDADGVPLRICDLDADSAAAVAALDVVEQYSGRGGARELTGFVKKYKLVDKGPNLERLMKYLGLYSVDNRQRGDPLEALLQAIAGSNRSTLRPVVGGVSLPEASEPEVPEAETPPEDEDPDDPGEGD